MPRKKKVISPEEKLKKFNDWKETEEYKLLVRIKDLSLKVKNDPLISKFDELSDDFTGKFDELLEEFTKIQSVFGIKGAKIKNLLQEHFRTIYFGAPPERQKAFYVDLEKLEYSDKCKSFNPENRHLRNTFIEIINFTETVEGLDENDYEFKRKERIINKFKDFAKRFKVHIARDKSHTVTKTFLYQVLDPLIKLMEVNNKLAIFYLENQDNKKFKENDFLYKALILEFCKRYQYCQEILYKKNRDVITKNPNIFSVFKKINYENWEKNKLENYFISPLNDSLTNLQTNLNKLYLLGFNFWRQPLSENKVFLNNVSELIENEDRTERLLGNNLSRNQINFLFNAILRIYNSEVKEKFIDKTNKERIKINIIAPLAILKALENINDVVKKKTDYIYKYNLEEDYLEENIDKKFNSLDKIIDSTESNNLIEYSLLNANEPGKLLTKNDILPKGVIYNEKIKLINGKNLLIPFDDNDYNELDKFGRLFIWSNFIPEDKVVEFFNLAKELRIINKTIIKDLENYFIIEGLYINLLDCIKKQDKKNAEIHNKFLINLKEEELKKEIYLKRPPYLFNELENKNSHKLLFNSNPLDIYEDGKIKYIHERITYFSKIIWDYKKDDWNFLVDNLFLLLNDMYQNENN